MKNVVLFGGCGFIGLNYAEHLFNLKKYDQIFLIDLKKPTNKFLKNKFLYLQKTKKVFFFFSDVRNNLNNLKIDNIDLILDFAAIHREPGHLDNEYFDTNVIGSQNIINFAKYKNCNNIIFISSISVYGPGDHEKKEQTITKPNTPYGKSKLQAEKKYINWHKENQLNRILTICRPGVVFGPGENGNVTRLIKAVKSRKFLYMGNKNLKKAGIYVKELVSILHWVNRKQKKKELNNFELLNGAFFPCPSLVNYVDAILFSLNEKYYFISIPQKLIKFFIFLTSYITKNISPKSNYNYVRLNKLFRSNFVVPQFLIKKNYIFKYDMKSSMTDWKLINPIDWN